MKFSNQWQKFAFCHACGTHHTNRPDRINRAFFHANIKCLRVLGRRSVGQKWTSKLKAEMLLNCSLFISSSSTEIFGKNAHNL